MLRLPTQLKITRQVRRSSFLIQGKSYLQAKMHAIFWLLYLEKLAESDMR